MTVSSANLVDFLNFRGRAGDGDERSSAFQGGGQRV